MDMDNLSVDNIREMMARMRSLEEENNLLRNEVARPNTPVMNQVPNVVVQPNLGSLASKPPKYDGSRKMVTLNIFVSKMRNFIVAQTNLDSQRQLAVASSYLEGSAYVWFLKWFNDNPYGSFDQFLNALHAQFMPMNSEQDVRDRLRRLKQLSSVEKYVDLFRKTLEEAPDMDEMEKKSFFIQGLKEKIQLEVRVRNMGNGLTFNEVERLALELDHIIFSQPRRGGNSAYVSSGRAPMEGIQFGLLKPEEQARFKREGRCFQCKRTDSHAEGCRSRYEFRSKLNVMEADESEPPNTSDTTYPVHLSSMRHEGPGAQLFLPLLIHEAKLQDGSKIDLLFDTGASANFVSKELVDRLRLVQKELNQPMLLKLGDASHSTHKLMNYVVIDLYDLKDRKMSIEAVVLEGIGYPVILGRPFQALMNATLGEKNNYLVCKDWVLKDSGTRQVIPAYNELNALLETDIYVDLAEIRRMEKDGQIQELFHILIREADKKTDENGQDLILNELRKDFSSILPMEGEDSCVTRDQKDRLSEIAQHQIIVDETNVNPVKRAPYRMSPAELDEVSRQLEKLSKKGYIRPSASPWASPVIFVRKKDNTLRMCVDFRALNKVTKADSYPLPRIDDNLDALGNSRYFSLVDLESGFHQISMHKDSVEKTAFTTRYGSYEYLVMPFGLRNAPSTFQRVMNKVLEELVDKICVVYLDDILVYSKSEEEHRKHLRMILERLMYYGLIVNVKKSKFYQLKVKYLGFVISHNSVEPDPEKVECIRDWPNPQSVTEVRSFIGLLNYYRRFIKNFSKLALPLLELTKKEKEFSWNEMCQDSFNSLKAALISAPVLKMPDYSSTFYVWPDASQTTMGGILTQKYGSDHHPIAFLSIKFSPAEQNYSTTERELLAILLCLRRWRCYIEGRETIVFTDHKPLTWARGLKNPKPRQYGWIEEIESYSPTISYIPGTQQPADALSRITKASVHDPEASPVKEDSPALFAGRSFGQAESSEKLDSLCKIEDNFNDLYATMKVLEIDGLRYPDSDWPLLCAKILCESPMPLLDAEMSDFVYSEVDNFEIKSGILMRRVDHLGETKLVPVITSDKRNEKIKQYHELLGHLASDAVYKILKERFWWPAMAEDIVVYISHCRQCGLARNERQSKAPLHPIPPAPLPFERWGMDFLQDLPRTAQNNRNVLVFVDYATRWTVVKAVPDRESQTVLKVFKDCIVQNYGLPEAVLSDRSQSFLGGVFADYLRRNNVKHLKTSSYHPRTNGMTERLNRTLKGMLKKYCDGFPNKWDKCLSAAEFALRVRIHTVTEFSPFFLLYGRHPRLPGDDAPEGLFDFDDEDERNEFTMRELENLGQARAASYFRSVNQAKKMVEVQKNEARKRNQNLIEDVFFPGTYVKKRNFVKESLDYPWNGPYIVSEVLPNSLYRLMKIDGTLMNPPVHQDDLRHYTGEKTTKYYHNNRMYDIGTAPDRDVQQSSEVEEFQELEEDSEFKEGGVVTLNPSEEQGQVGQGQNWETRSEGADSNSSLGSRVSIDADDCDDD